MSKNRLASDFLPGGNNDFRVHLSPPTCTKDNVHNQDAHGKYKYVCIHSPQVSNFERTIHLFISGRG